MIRATMRILGAVAGGVLLVAACSSGVGGPQSAAHSTARPESSRTPVPSGGTGGQPSSPAQLDRCHTSGLVLVTVRPAAAGAGNIYVELGLRNSSLNACWVYGFVGAALLDSAGHQLPTRVLRDTGGQWFAFAHVGTYTVQPGATAPFWVHWGDVVVGSNPSCTTGTGLLVTPPDETTQLRMNLSAMACNGGELDVSPVTAPGTTEQRR